MSKLNEWVKTISQQELPIFRYTLNAINNVVAEEDSSTAELAQVILQDASLTARILRIANSTVYNPNASPINTISRAIVFIGFNMVRDLSLSLAIIEALLNRKGKQHVLRLMARAFHAALQARAMAMQQGDETAEEVFIAALLYHIGEMAFWCVAGEEGERILALIEQQGFEAPLAQNEVLGFTFDQLSLALSHDWHLGDLLGSAINNPGLSNPRIQSIQHGHRLAEATMQGWDSRATADTIKTIARQLDMPAEQTRDWLRDNALQAIEVARMFGATAIIEYLPIPAACEIKLAEDAPQPATPYATPDTLLQLSILRDLSRMLEQQPNINLILETILEGIYRGVGMDRTLFALLTPDKQQIRGKYALGDDNQQLTRRFQFALQNNAFFTWLFRQPDMVWVKDSQDPQQQPAVPAELRQAVAVRGFFIHPLILQNKPIGIIYADRQPSRRELDKESCESFRHFCLQARMSIEYVSQGKR